MTKYITIDCDLAWKCIGYGMWILISILAIIGSISSGATLDTYTASENGTQNWCHIDYWSKEKVCLGGEHFSLDYESKFSMTLFFYTSLTVLVGVQVGAILILNLIHEWVGVRCKE